MASLFKDLPRTLWNFTEQFEYPSTAQRFTAMKSLLFALSLSLLPASLLIAEPVQTIGGEKIVTITRTAVSKTVPEFTSVTVLPGRGMELLYISANFPGKGEIPVLLTPDLATAARQLDEQDTPTG